MLLNGCGSADNRVQEETFERVYAIEPSARLTIQNRDGVVSIYGSDTSEMRLNAVKKAYSQELQRSGKWVSIWRVTGHHSNLSVFDVADNDALHEILWGLPLFAYMTIHVTPLARHPSAI